MLSSSSSNPILQNINPLLFLVMVLGVLEHHPVKQIMVCVELVLPIIQILLVRSEEMFKKLIDVFLFAISYTTS
jgi:NADH:ubiquinone oxidoreductase subunit K